MANQADITALSKTAQKLNLLPEQIQYAHYLAKPKAYRPPIDQLTEELGVHKATLYRWQRNKRVQAMVRELMKRYFFDDLPDILEAMKVKALQGDTRAAQLVIDYIENFRKNEQKNTQPITNNIFITRDDVDARILELKNKVIDI